MEDLQRHAAAHEPVEGVEALTAHHQEPILFRRAVKITG